MKTALNITLLASALLLALLSSLAPASAAETEVLRWTRDGDYVWETSRERIITEDYSSITYEGLGRQSRNDIIFVLYNNDLYYTAAEKRFNDGEYRAAIPEFKKALEKGRKEWVQWYARFRLGQIYGFLGDAKTALKYYKELNEKYPKNPFYPQVNVNMARIYIIKGNFDAAQKLLKEVINRRRDFMVCWVEKAQIMLGNIYLFKRDFKAAERHFKSIEPRLTYKDLKMEARFGLGKCLEEKGRMNKDVRSVKAAIKVYENIASQYHPLSLIKAYAYIARCYYNLNDFEKAYWYGLRGGLLFLKEYPGTSAESLFYALKALYALYNAETDADKKKFYGENIILIKRLFRSELFGQKFAVMGLNLK